MWPRTGGGCSTPRLVAYMSSSSSFMVQPVLPFHSRVVALRVVNRTTSSATTMGKSMMSCSRNVQLPIVTWTRRTRQSFSSTRCLSTTNENNNKPPTPATASPPIPVIDPRVYPVVASSLLSGTAVGVLFPVIPLFARDLGLSPSDFGLIVGMMGLTRLIFNVPSAWATDRFGRRFTLIGGPLLSSLGMLIMASATSLSQLLGSRFLTGVGGSMQMTGAQLYLFDISTPQNRARTMAPMGIAFATGATVGPALGGWMADAAGLRAPFYFVATATCIVSLSNYFMLPETRKSVLEGKLQPKQQLSLKEEFNSISSQWRPLLRDSRMRSVLGMHLSYWAVQSGCTWTLLPLLAANTFNLSTSSLGSMFALMSFVGIVCMRPAAWVSDRYGRKFPVMPSSALVAASLTAMPFAQSHEQLLGLVMLSSIGSTFFQATPQAYVADISTEETRGQALALLRSAGDAGLLFGASTFGLLAQLTNVSVSFGVASAIMLGASYNFARTKDDDGVIVSRQ